MKPNYSERKYIENECCVFRKTKGKYGGLSNMASGFPLKVNGINIYSSEALYQACRFPHLPDVQQEILIQKSPMTAKMKSKPHRKFSRSDWETVNVKIMQWCLKVKLAQNFIKFGLALEETYFKPIVEDSSKDDFWGAKRQKENKELLVGINALGRLLMDLREKYFSEDRYSLLLVEPLSINDFLLLNKPIPIIDERANFISYLKSKLNIIDYDLRNINEPSDLVKENIENIKTKTVKRRKKTKSINPDVESLFGDVG